jgi:hypothetical protein
VINVLFQIQGVFKNAQYVDKTLVLWRYLESEREVIADFEIAIYYKCDLIVIRVEVI